jgi:predicted enzyme related to lactoylglutathione lyase
VGSGRDQAASRATERLKRPEIARQGGCTTAKPRACTGANSSAIRDGIVDTDYMEVSVSTDVSPDAATEVPATRVDMKLEVVVLPVADVDRAQQFYESLEWRLDAEFAAGDFRVVQLTPPGSQASVIFGAGVTSAAPGSGASLVLAVDDLEAARAGLVARGVDVSEIFHDEGGVFVHAGTTGRVPGPDPERRSYSSWASFSDPDGNGWLLQEITTRLPGRVE